MTTNPTPHAAALVAHITPLAQHIPQPLKDCFAAQRAAFDQQRCPSLAERRADLRALHRLLLDNREALVDAVNRDFGCRSRFETLMTERAMGVTRACGLVGISRSVFRYESQRAEANVQLTARLAALAAEKRRYGYRRLHVLIRREGHVVNWKRLYRKRLANPSFH